jgi:hypothetical protein
MGLNMKEKMSLDEFLNHNAPSEDAIEEIAFKTLSRRYIHNEVIDFNIEFNKAVDALVHEMYRLYLEDKEDV